MLSGHSMLCLLTGDNLGQCLHSLASSRWPVAPPRTEDQASRMLFGLSVFSRQHVTSVSIGTVGIQLV